ncbi:hypothetical protein FPV67DRAFT_1667743 [Lyophyllum atratum]|nr:hypothetical protein FPV67DRAFT_1667743 [Lyophyllum atratum]
MISGMFVPADIVYIILDKLCSDSTSLKNCARVSRSFHSHCQKLLFSHICLVHPASTRGLYRAISANASLAGYIRTVEVISRIGVEFRGRDWVTIEHTLAPLLQSLHNLESFIFRNTYQPALPWSTLPADLRQAILEISAPNITLEYIANPPMGPLGRLVGLKRLSLMDIVSDAEHTLDLGVLGMSPHSHQHLGYLESLKIKAAPACGQHLVRTLTDSRSRLRLSRLKELELNGNSGFEGAIMEAAGLALERVVWRDLGDQNEGPFQTFPSSFSMLPALRSLTLSTQFTRGHPHDPLPLLAQALANATAQDACSLAHLEIDIDFYGVWKFAITQRDIEFLEQYAFWAALNQSLIRPGVYSKLERVTVILRIGGGVEAFSSLPRRRLKGLLDIGVLNMVYKNF